MILLVIIMILMCLSCCSYDGRPLFFSRLLVMVMILWSSISIRPNSDDDDANAPTNTTPIATAANGPTVYDHLPSSILILTIIVIMIRLSWCSFQHTGRLLFSIAYWLWWCPFDHLDRLLLDQVWSGRALLLYMLSPRPCFCSFYWSVINVIGIASTTIKVFPILLLIRLVLLWWHSPFETVPARPILVHQSICHDPVPLFE